MKGIVVEFDDDKGIGTVRGDGGDHFFHCTQIASGSRTIAAGTEVTYDLGPGHRGQWEARNLTPVD